MKIFLGVMFFIHSLLSYADIYSYQNPATDYIRLTEDQSKMSVKFESCRHLPNHSSQCVAIGKKDTYYPKLTLKLLRESEKFDVITSITADIAIIAGGIYAGAGIGSAIGYSVSASSMPLFYIEAGAATGIAGGVSLAGVVDMLNPYEQIKQLETITDEVLMDETVIVDTELKTFSKRLAQVLRNLDNHAWITFKNGVFQSIMLQPLED